jgi:hypothetical protein
MQAGKAFFVVGHSRWGKSSTLIALTGSHREREHEMGGRVFSIRRTSNDDEAEAWIRASGRLRPDSKPYLILTLCPTTEVQPALESLRDRYHLYFWIMRDKQQGHPAQISDEEIARLRGIGTVRILEGRREPPQRAELFVTFIREQL